MLEYFTDWQKKTVTFEQFVSTTNAAGQPVESWVAVSGGADLDVNFWTDSSRETNVNDRFVDQRVGSLLVAPDKITFTPDTTMRFKIGSDVYYVTGVDDKAAFGEVYVINWRQEI